MDEQFQIIKGHFNKQPLRSYPPFGEETAKFKVRTDFSMNNLGPVLEQVQDGQKQFIAAIGQKTTAGGNNYSPMKGELAAIFYALRKW